MVKPASNIMYFRLKFRESIKDPVFRKQLVEIKKEMDKDKRKTKKELIK